MQTICLIPWDGVGRDVVPAAAEVLAALAPDLRFIHAEAGWGCFERYGTALPQATLDAVSGADATLFGATQSPSGQVPGYSSPILALRRHFDLFANLRPARDLPGGDRGVDLLIVRENTEGLYSGRERREGDTAIAERVITRRASERIARTACQQALVRADQRSRRPALTVVHKANVLKQSDGLFRETCLAVVSEYPDIELSEMLVDAAAMWLAKDPGRFDVIVTTNLFGDILSDLVAGLVGGLGVAPSANVGAGQVALFEPVHGSAPDIAGRGIANPVGAMLSAAMMMDHLDREEDASRLRSAVRATLASGVRTPDLGGDRMTADVVASVLELLTADPRLEE